MKKDINQLKSKSLEDVHYKNSFGNTPLHTAAAERNEETLKLLIDREANANSKTVIEEYLFTMLLILGTI